MLKDGITKEPVEGAEEAENTAALAESLEESEVAVVSNRPFSPTAVRTFEAADEFLVEHICAQLDGAMREKGLPTPTGYNADTQRLLCQAWSMAKLLNSRAVISFHLFAALANSNERVAQELPELAGKDPSWLLAGAVMRTALLRAAPQKTAVNDSADRIIPTSLQLVRWVSEAGILAARSRTDSPALQVKDLVEVLRDPQGDANVKKWVRQLLRDASDLGKEPAEYVKTRHEVSNAHRTVRQFRSATTKRFRDLRGRMKGIEDEVRAVSESVKNHPSRLPSPDLGPVLAAVDGLPTQLQSTITAQGDRIQSSVREAAARHDGALAAVDRRTAVVEEKASTLEAHAADIKRHLAPPSAGWLAASVLAVLALGVGAGLMMVP